MVASLPCVVVMLSSNVVGVLEGGHLETTGVVMARQRRAPGDGGMTKKTGYYRHADGTSTPYTYWQASREVPADQLPKGLDRKRVTGSGRSEKEARARLEENYQRFLTGEAKRGATRLSGKVTVQRLFEEWDRHNQAGAVTPNVARSYQGMFTNHILPALGALRLDALNVSILSAFFNDTLPKKTKRVTGEDGAEEEVPLLGPSARRNIYVALQSALSFSVEMGYLAASPLAGVKAPTKVKPDEDVDAFIADAHKVRAAVLAGNHPDETRWLMALLGLRQSERLGLAWSSFKGLDTDSPTLTVNRQLHRIPGKGLTIKKATKTDRTRVIRLADPWVTSLRAYRETWEELRQGDKWEEPKAEFRDLLFLKPNGTPVSHKQDTDEWHDLLQSCGVSYWRGHLMRHYTAVMLAEQPGVSMNDVMSILGHDTEATSYYYAHLDKQRNTQTLATLGKRLTGDAAKPQRAPRKRR